MDGISNGLFFAVVGRGGGELLTFLLLVTTSIITTIASHTDPHKIAVFLVELPIEHLQQQTFRTLQQSACSLLQIT